ncbi:immunoglobulin-like domain-containing protein [Paenibacillus alkalitolerans]|uniref:immunoglobulin-like domain-containing protein n=1 Tax=Paenibacillus alkalitolerans TaxID=2799335 RepID=UPI0018F6602A|nr:immunoglobulin-like domain-containing protein [Paenibacillus alkalitolerans]
MKKKWLLLSALAVSLVAANAAYAKPVKQEPPRSGQVEQKAKGLENALKHVKNPKARAAIMRALERQKQRVEQPPVETAEQIVAADKAALAIGFSSGDSAGSVTSPLKLPATGKYGSVIAWSSNNPAVISNDGKTVNRPTSGSGDATVIMTATITKNTVSATKQFTLIVKSQRTDEEKVAADKAALAIGFSTGDSASHVTSKLTLPATGANGSTISWVSGNPAVITNDGKTVNRPKAGDGDTAVTLIATIRSGNIADMKVFTVTVKQQMTDEQKVAADKAALSIGFSTGDSASHVTSKLTLPATGANGSTITWVSGNPSIISDNGQTVNRPKAGDGDAEVTFIATIKHGDYTDVRLFTVTVKQQLLTDAQKAAADKAVLAIGFSGTDNANSVTSNIALPAKGVNGSTIYWSSSNNAVVSDNGTVTRPAAGTNDATVTLSAIIVYNAAVEIKTFTITVKKLP